MKEYLFGWFRYDLVWWKENDRELKGLWNVAWRDFLNGSLWDFSAKDTEFRAYAHLLFLTESQCLLEQAACGLASAGDHMTKSHSGACTAMETSHECPTKCDTTVDPVCSNANVTYSLCPLQSMQSSIKRNILYFLTKNYFDTNSDFSHFFISQKTHVSWSRLTVDFWNTTTPHT